MRKHGGLPLQLRAIMLQKSFLKIDSLTPCGRALIDGRIDGIKSNLDSLEWWLKHAERMRELGISSANAEGGAKAAILRIQEWANRLAESV